VKAISLLSIIPYVAPFRTMISTASSSVGVKISGYTQTLIPSDYSSRMDASPDNVTDELKCGSTSLKAGSRARYSDNGRLLFGHDPPREGSSCAK